MSEYISKESIVTLLEQYGYIDKEMERDLVSIPSADVRPNIHAYWDFIGDNCFKCTACKEVKTYNEITNSNGERAKFCPECGAVMDGKPFENCHKTKCEACIYHGHCDREDMREPKGRKAVSE